MSPIDLGSLRTTSSDVAIRKIRNHLVGKQALKQSAIEAGLLPALGDVLRSETSGDEHFLEAAAVVSILANEGPSFVQPILRSDIPTQLVQKLALADNLRTSVGLLKCLNTIASELPTGGNGQWSEEPSFAELLYGTNIIWVRKGLESKDVTFIERQTCDLTIALLCKTCKAERHRSYITDNAILSLLAQRLAAFIVAEGLIAPSLEAIDFPASATAVLPEAASPKGHLSPILEAIALLIENSRRRAEIFLSDPAIEAVFPRSTDLFTLSSIRQAPWGGNTSARMQYRFAIDAILPTVPVRVRAGSASNLNFPPLGAGPLQRRRSSFHPNPPQAANVAFTTDARDEEEKGIIPALLFIARDSRGKRRLVACRLLAVLLDLKFIPKSRSRAFAYLLVPLVVRMLDVQEPLSDHSANNGSYMSDGIFYSKAAPAILGKLIMDDADFQKVAVDAQAISKIASSLKKTFETSSVRKGKPWKPYKDVDMDLEITSDDCRLGPFGPSRRARLEMKYREGLLQALANIAPSNDDYRKQICDQGVLPHIMQAMETYTVRKSVTGVDEIVGNSASTILAACGCIRALTRSVTALRTKLVDADVAKSVIKLMDSSDPEIRIAATTVVTNLAMDFSPMKESFSHDNLVKILCNQARSTILRLRLESLWALKQLAVNAPLVLKLKIVSELDCGWIRQLISTDPADTLPSGTHGSGMSQSDSQRTSATEDIIMREESDDDDDDATDNFEEVIPDTSWANDAVDRPETDYLIQCQLLDLLRNLFCGDNASDLVDSVLTQVGPSDFFEILRKRLSNRRVLGATRKENIEHPPRADIVLKVLYTVVHIAACSQAWRRAVTNEGTLLKLVLAFHNHSQREIRVLVCWVAINLLYEDDVSDRFSCRQRAIDLSKIGYREKVAKMENDPDLDVRERAKSATSLFNNLLDPRS